MTEEYITQFSEGNEGTFTKKLSQDFSRTESPVLGALPKPDEFLLNPQLRTCSVSVPGTSLNNDSENREPTSDCSLKDPYREVEFSACRTSNLTDPDPEETAHMVTIVQEEIPQCSPGTSSGKQKKSSCTSQPQFRSEFTP